MIDVNGCGDVRSVLCFLLSFLTSQPLFVHIPTTALFFCLPFIRTKTLTCNMWEKGFSAWPMPVQEPTAPNSSFAPSAHRGWMESMVCTQFSERLVMPQTLSFLWRTRTQYYSYDSMLSSVQFFVLTF